MTDTKLFKSVLMLKGYTIASLADEIKMSKTTLSYKANNKREFFASEIERIVRVLSLSAEEMIRIFFAPCVDEWQHPVAE